jgi:beta-N-acetylhexosaminidase
MPVRRAVAALAALSLITACSATPADRSPSAPGRTPSGAAQPDALARATAAAAKFADVDLVGQVLVPYAYGRDATTVSTAAANANQTLAGVDTPAEMIAKFHLGGMILVSFSTDDPTSGTNTTSNFDTPAQVKALTAGMQAAGAKLPAAVPLLIGTDQEYGVVTRMKTGVLQLPSAIAFGAAHQPDLTRAAWAAAGADLAAIGINVDYAPDADVLAGPGNTVIGSRSFGSTPADVSAQVAAAVAGLESAGVAATLKHFPGHGNTSTDSHSALPVLTQPLAKLTAVDLAPFKAGIAAGADMIMSGHLDVTAIDPGTPASFSHKVLIDLLRTQLGFRGVVITDALNMEPAEVYSPGEAAVRAVLAGNDMLLMPVDLAAAQAALLAALKSGRLSRDALRASVARILALKYKVGAGPPAARTLDSPASRAAAAKLAAASITLLRGPCQGALVSGSVTVVASAGRGGQAATFAAALRAQGLTVVDSGGTVVDLVGYGDSGADLDARAAVTVDMDTPYVLAKAKSKVLIAAYSSTAASLNAVAAILAGKATAPGRSPVTVTGLPKSACAAPTG